MGSSCIAQGYQLGALDHLGEWDMEAGRATVEIKAIGLYVLAMFVRDMGIYVYL